MLGMWGRRPACRSSRRQLTALVLVAVLATACTDEVADGDRSSSATLFTDGFAGGDWDDAAWLVEVPGRDDASAATENGVMQIDPAGTFEWARAVAVGSEHLDADLRLSVEATGDSHGTVFVALRGDGEWRDATSYLPQTGVVLEYQYAPSFGGEVAVIDAIDPGELPREVATGPTLDAGDRAWIRMVVRGDRLLAKVWRDGDEEPGSWLFDRTIQVDGPGVVQLAFRDDPGQLIRWGDLALVEPA